MLVPVITFQIHNFETSISEEFVMRNTLENQELVFSNRHTRAIVFDQLFEFELAKKERIPSELLDTFQSQENLIDSIDEMVGVFA